MKTAKPSGAAQITIAKLEKISQRIVQTPSCWLWEGAHTKKGYAETFSHKVVYVHRLMYELVHGPITRGLVVDHSCSNTGCVNPAHLRLLTNAANIARRYEDRPKTHCKRGHLLSPENVRAEINPRNGRPRRVCRLCVRLLRQTRRGDMPRAGASSPL